MDSLWCSSITGEGRNLGFTEELLVFLLFSRGGSTARMGGTGYLLRFLGLSGAYYGRVKGRVV